MDGHRDPWPEVRILSLGLPAASEGGHRRRMVRKIKTVTQMIAIISFSSATGDELISVPFAQIMALDLL